MPELKADLVITGGHIITVNQQDEVVEAVAVVGDKIIAVGSAHDIAAYIGDRTEVIQLNGQTMLPGLIEPHTHFMNYSIRFTYVNCRTPPNKNIPEILDRIRKKASETPKGEWILAQGIWDKSLEEKRFPTREELDSVAPDHPLYITLRIKHAVIVNSRGLELVGYDESTPQPVGGHLDKDPATGRLTGVLREKAAFKPVDALLPPVTKDDMKKGVIEVGKLYSSAGITSAHDAGAPTIPDTYRAYQEAVEEDLLKIRVYLMIQDRPYNHFYLKRDLGLRTGFGNNRLRMGPVKTCTDGSIQVRTGAFYEPYIKLDSEHLREHPRGSLQMPVEEINAVVLEAHEKGYQVAIHTQGDYGVDVAIDAIENALKKHPRENHRHRIEHCHCATLEGLKRMGRLGIIGSFYPHHTWFWGDQHVSDWIGRQRADRIEPMKSSIKSGVVTIAHSDAPIFQIGDPVCAADPLFGIWCAVNRNTRGGLKLGPEERISPMEGIRAYTINAAYASFEEKIKGSIEPGKLADFAILSDNPCEVDPWEIRNIKVKRTIIGGETVFQAD